MSSPPSQPPEQQPSAKPGKIWTWWHPLLAALLRWQLGSHYHLEEEVPVGKKPLQIDMLLLQKMQGELPESVRKVLAGLVEYLGELTLLEFKSPSDTLRAGDFQTFLAYAFLYRAQNNPLLELSKLHLLVLAPKLTSPYQDELRTLGVTAQHEERGIWRLQGGPAVHPTWVLETDELAGVNHPLLTLVSPKFLENRLATYDTLRQSGYTELVVYLAQQITQFRLRGQEFAMQHLGTEDELVQVMRDLLATMTPEERLEWWPIKKHLEDLQQVGAETELKQALRDLVATRSPEELCDLVTTMSPKARLQGLSEQEILRGLTPEQWERLRRLLQQPPPGEGDSASPKKP